MIVWDAGTAITVSSVITVVGRLVRVEFTTVPAYLSHSGDTPPRYYSLGTIGEVVDGRYSPGTRLLYTSQSPIEISELANSVYVILVTGAAATVYQGVEIMGEPVIGCQVYRNSVQSIPNNTLTAITFDTEVRDPFNMHSLSSNTSRITAPAPGWYSCVSTVRWASNASGYREAYLRTNGNAYQIANTAPGAASANYPVLIVSGPLWLDKDDYVELVVNQTSGGALDAAYNPGESLSMRVAMIVG